MALTKQSRYTFYVLGLVVLALAGGYAGGQLGSSGGSSVQAATSAGNTSSGNASWIQKIKSAGVLRVGCADSPPTIIVKSDGTCSGADLIPMQDFAAGLGVKLQTISTTWQNIVAGLQTGKYDVAADLDQTVQRGLAIAFTDSSWSYPGVFLVQRSGKNKTSAQILASGQPIATSQGTALDSALQQLKASELRVDTYENAASAVHAGRAVAVFTDLGTAVDIADKDPSFGIVVPSPAIFVHYVAYGVPTSIDARSMDVINIAINNAVASGEVARAFAAAGYRDLNALGNLQIQP